MNLSESFNIWRRWWMLTAALLIVTCASTAAVVPGMRSYQSESQVVLLASRSASRANGGNPYLSFSSSLTLTADAVSQEIMAPATAKELAAHGHLAAYTVALAPYTTDTTGSFLLVTVTGKNRSEVENTLRAVTDEISAELVSLQQGVTARGRVQAVTLSYSPQAALSVKKTLRSAVPVALAGLLFALGLPIAAEGWLARRRARRQLATSPRGAPVRDDRLPSPPSGHGHRRDRSAPSDHVLASWTANEPRYRADAAE